LMASRTFCSTGDSALSDVVARSAARIKNRSIDIFNENTGETPHSQGLVDNKCAHRVDLDLENAYYGVPFRSVAARKDRRSTGNAVLPEGGPLNL